MRKHFYILFFYNWYQYFFHDTDFLHKMISLEWKIKIKKGVQFQNTEANISYHIGPDEILIM